MSIKMCVRSSRRSSGLTEIHDVNLWRPHSYKKTVVLWSPEWLAERGIRLLPQWQNYSTTWSADMKLVPLHWERILGCWPSLTGLWEHLCLCCGCQPWHQAWWGVMRKSESKGRHRSRTSRGGTVSPGEEPLLHASSSESAFCDSLPSLCLPGVWLLLKPAEVLCVFL